MGQIPLKTGINETRDDKDKTISFLFLFTSLKSILSMYVDIVKMGEI